MTKRLLPIYIQLFLLLSVFSANAYGKVECEKTSVLRDSSYKISDRLRSYFGEEGARQFNDDPTIGVDTQVYTDFSDFDLDLYKEVSASETRVTGVDLDSLNEQIREHNQLVRTTCEEYFRVLEEARKDSIERARKGSPVTGCRNGFLIQQAEFHSNEMIQKIKRAGGNVSVKGGSGIEAYFLQSDDQRLNECIDSFNSQLKIKCKKRGVLRAQQCNEDKLKAALTPAPPTSTSGTTKGAAPKVQCEPEESSLKHEGKPLVYCECIHRSSIEGDKSIVLGSVDMSAEQLVNFCKENKNFSIPVDPSYRDDEEVVKSNYKDERSLFNAIIVGKKKAKGISELKQYKESDQFKTDLEAALKETKSICDKTKSESYYQTKVSSPTDRLRERINSYNMYKDAIIRSCKELEGKTADRPLQNKETIQRLEQKRSTILTEIQQLEKSSPSEVAQTTPSSSGDKAKDEDESTPKETTEEVVKSESGKTQAPVAKAGETDSTTEIKTDGKTRSATKEGTTRAPAADRTRSQQQSRVDKELDDISVGRVELSSGADIVRAVGGDPEKTPTTEELIEGLKDSRTKRIAKVKEDLKALEKRRSDAFKAKEAKLKEIKADAKRAAKEERKQDKELEAIRSKEDKARKAKRSKEDQKLPTAKQKTTIAATRKQDDDKRRADRSLEDVAIKAKRKEEKRRREQLKGSLDQFEFKRSELKEQQQAAARLSDKSTEDDIAAVESFVKSQNEQLAKQDQATSEVTKGLATLSSPRVENSPLKDVRDQASEEAPIDPLDSIRASIPTGVSEDTPEIFDTTGNPVRPLAQSDESSTKEPEEQEGPPEQGQGDPAEPPQTEAERAQKAFDDKEKQDNTPPKRETFVPQQLIVTKTPAPRVQSTSTQIPEFCSDVTKAVTTNGPYVRNYLRSDDGSVESKIASCTGGAFGNAKFFKKGGGKYNEKNLCGHLIHEYCPTIYSMYKACDNNWQDWGKGVVEFKKASSFATAFSKGTNCEDSMLSSNTKNIVTLLTTAGALEGEITLSPLEAALNEQGNLNLTSCINAIYNSRVSIDDDEKIVLDHKDEKGFMTLRRAEVAHCESLRSMAVVGTNNFEDDIDDVETSSVDGRFTCKRPFPWTVDYNSCQALVNTYSGFLATEKLGQTAQDVELSVKQQDIQDDLAEKQIKGENIQTSSLDAIKETAELRSTQELRKEVFYGAQGLTLGSMLGGYRTPGSTARDCEDYSRLDSFNCSHAIRDMVDLDPSLKDQFFPNQDVKRAFYQILIETSAKFLTAELMRQSFDKQAKIAKEVKDKFVLPDGPSENDFTFGELGFCERRPNHPTCRKRGPRVTNGGTDLGGFDTAGNVGDDLAVTPEIDDGLGLDDDRALSEGKRKQIDNLQNIIANDKADSFSNDFKAPGAPDVQAGSRGGGAATAGGAGASGGSGGGGAGGGGVNTASASNGAVRKGSVKFGKDGGVNFKGFGGKSFGDNKKDKPKNAFANFFGKNDQGRSVANEKDTILPKTSSIFKKISSRYVKVKQENRLLDTEKKK